MNTSSDNKLLIPMLSNIDKSSDVGQIEMTLTSKDSIPSNRTNILSSGVLSEDERNIAVNNLDSIVCKMIDESFADMDENMKTEDE